MKSSSSDMVAVFQRSRVNLGGIKRLRSNTFRAERSTGNSQEDEVVKLFGPRLCLPGAWAATDWFICFSRSKEPSVHHRLNFDKVAALPSLFQHQLTNPELYFLRNTTALLIELF